MSPQYERNRRRYHGTDYGPGDRLRESGDEFEHFREIGPNRMVQKAQPEEWEIPGPFTGRGPKSYQRRDDLICEEICERLKQHGKVDATGIDVSVSDGIVELKGVIDRKEEKYLAEDAAYRVAGVQDVKNHLRVESTSGARVRGAGSEDVVMPGRIQPGMRVYDRDERLVGVVKRVREADFLLDRPLARDIFVPFTAVQKTNGDILLKVTEGDFRRQDWARVAIFGGGSEHRIWPEI